jgi:serine/threonine-protein kinase
VDRRGHATPLPLPPRSYLNARISPDGEQIAVEVEGPNHDFYIHDIGRGVTSRVTNDGVSHGPILSPDGKRSVYRSWRDGKMTLYWMPSGRSGPSERLMKTTAWQHAVSFSPDGGNLIFDQWDGENRVSNDWELPTTGDRQPRPLSQSKFSEGAGMFSPDGKWLVYCSMESGKAELYVQPWPGPGPKIQISLEGGMDPIWRHDGKEIFYRNGGRLTVVTVNLGPPLKAGRPQALWKGSYTFSLSSSCGLKGVTTASYDVTPDGRRFLMAKDNEQEMYATRIVVVLSWVEELERIVAEAAGKKT